jgi:hypothetical protein
MLNYDVGDLKAKEWRMQGTHDCVIVGAGRFLP